MSAGSIGVLCPDAEPIPDQQSPLDSDADPTTQLGNAMSRDQAKGVGQAVLLLGAIFEIQHMVAGIMRPFTGCRTWFDLWDRLSSLDEPTIAGMLMYCILVVALIAAAGGDVIQRFRR